MAPTYQCTPIFGGTPTPCDQAARDNLATEQARYAEAERIYRESATLGWELAGAKKPASKEILATATGDYRQSIIDSLQENMRSALVVSGTEDVMWMKPTDHTRNGSTLAMEVCISPGTSKIIASDGQLPDHWYLDRAFFKQIDGKLLISDNISTTLESPC